MVKTILPFDLISMNDYVGKAPLVVQLVYQKDEPPNIFGKIYRDDAQLWLHKDLAAIVLHAARDLHTQTGYRLILYDGLRTIEAQALMSQSDIVKANPQWLTAPDRLLSPPGGGAHPRGMAIDLSIIDERGTPIDMGTDFDYLAENSSPEHNPAHRDHPNLSATVKTNRALLTDIMINTAQILNLPLSPLPQEWWDFRAPKDVYEQYTALSDHDLPQEMYMSY